MWQRRIKKELSFQVWSHMSLRTIGLDPSEGMETRLKWGTFPTTQSKGSSQWLPISFSKFPHWVSVPSVFLHSLWIAKGKNNFSLKFIYLMSTRATFLFGIMDSMLDKELWDHLSYGRLECGIGAEKRKEYLIIKEWLVCGWLYNCLLISIPSPFSFTR